MLGCFLFLGSNTPNYIFIKDWKLKIIKTVYFLTLLVLAAFLEYSEAGVTLVSNHPLIVVLWHCLLIWPICLILLTSTYLKKNYLEKKALKLLIWSIVLVLFISPYFTYLKAVDAKSRSDWLIELESSVSNNPG